MTRRWEKLVLLAVSLWALFAVGAAVPVSAQTPYSAAYTVNTSVITKFDLAQRTALLQAFGVSGNLDDLALEQLIDDRLKAQAAEDLGISLEPGALAQGLDEFAGRRNMTGAELNAALLLAGVTQQAIDDFVISGLLWRAVVQARFSAKATPSDADLDAVLQIAVSGLQESVKISEIVIPHAELGENEARILAKRLSHELDGRGDFAAAARRYSRAPTAPTGGALGWVPADQLPPGLAGLVLSLMPGEVTAPIETPQAILLLKLHGVRREPAKRQTKLSVTYARLSVPLNRDNGPKAARARLRKVSGQAGTCRDMAALARDFGPGSGQFGPVPVSELSGAIGRQLAGLSPGQKTVVRGNGEVSLLLLCTRQVDVDPEQRAALREQLFNQRMNSFGQGYLQELRRDAVVIAR
ncbi:MAG: peptidylprolyl isomerase [Paracoccaceae bacterium]